MTYLLALFMKSVRLVVIRDIGAVNELYARMTKADEMRQQFGL
jgi:hypothetical protein